MIAIIKIAVALAFLALAIGITQVVKSGRRTVLIPIASWRENSITRHKRLANLALWLALTAVVLTETMVRFQGGFKSNWLFPIHLGFALPSLILIVTLRFFLTGLKNPRWHRRVAYTLVILFTGTLTTGVKLLFFS